MHKLSMVRKPRKAGGHVDQPEVRSALCNSKQLFQGYVAIVHRASLFLPCGKRFWSSAVCFGVVEILYCPIVPWSHCVCVFFSFKFSPKP